MLDGPEVQSTADQPALGYFIRVFWMAFGNVALFFAWLNVAGSNRIGAADVVYGALTLSLLFARWIDITKLNGMTIRTMPATHAHLRRYCVALLGIAITGWALGRWLSTMG